MEQYATDHTIKINTSPPIKHDSGCYETTGTSLISLIKETFSIIDEWIIISDTINGH